MSYLYLDILAFAWITGFSLDGWPFLDNWPLSLCLIFIWMFDLCLDVWSLSLCLTFIWMSCLCLDVSTLSTYLTFIWIRDLCLVRLNYLYLNVSPLCSISHSSLDVFPMSGSLVFSGFLVFIWTSGLCLDVWYLSGCLVFIWMFDLCLDVWPLPGCLHGFSLDGSFSW